MDRRILSFLILSLLAVFSCSDESDLSSVNIGDSFITPQTSIALIDTFSLKLSTILIDSIPTSNPENLMVGNYTDEFLGEVGATSYFQVTVPTTTTMEEKAVFDSLTLVLKYAGVEFGDTLQPQTIYVHRVTEEMEEPDEAYMYNTTSFLYDDSPIGLLSFRPRPNFKDSIEIRLDDALGLELMSLIKDKDDKILNSEDFMEYLKGIALVGDGGSNSVLGFKAVDSLVNIVLYTHEVKEERIETQYKFPLYSDGIYFNHFDFDRTGTAIGNIKTQKEEIPSADSDDKTFIQSGAGIVTRLDFTGLEKIMEMGNHSFFYKAEIILKPYPNSFSQVAFPEEIMLYTTDKYNRLVSEIQNSNDETLLADFYFDEQYNENNFYRFDITTYLNNELSDAYFDPNNGLIITVPSTTFQGSLERLVLDARKADSYRPVLNLYFVFYE